MPACLMALAGRSSGRGAGARGAKASLRDLSSRRVQTMELSG